MYNYNLPVESKKFFDSDFVIKNRKFTQEKLLVMATNEDMENDGNS